jgi:hypothetical protein
LRIDGRARRRQLHLGVCEARREGQQLGAKGRAQVLPAVQVSRRARRRNAQLRHLLQQAAVVRFRRFPGGRRRLRFLA